MAESFSDIGKVEAIDQLYRLSAYHPVPGLTYTAANGGKVHTAARMFLEGIDFNLVYFPLKHLGYKCVVGTVGELYASLAHPKLLNVILGISSKLDFDHVKELWMGITVAAKEHGFEAVNLDLQPSNNGLFISLAATGETSLLTDKRRMAAKSKDLLCISGRLGAAYLGMQVLEKGRKDFEKTGQQPDMAPWRMFVGDYLRPELDAAIVSKLEDAEIYPSFGRSTSRSKATPSSSASSWTSTRSRPPSTAVTTSGSSSRSRSCMRKSSAGISRPSTSSAIWPSPMRAPSSSRLKGSSSR